MTSEKSKVSVSDRNHNPTTAPVPAASMPSAQADARRAPNPRIPAVAGRRVASLERGATPEERATKTVAKLRGKRPDFAAMDEASYRELVEGRFGQKPDRPDGSHVCSLDGCKRWAGFTESKNAREVAAVVLVEEVIPYFICCHHYRGAIWSFRERDRLRDALREARKAGDKQALTEIEAALAALVRISAFGSLEKARPEIERATGMSRSGDTPVPPAPRPSQARPRREKHEPRPASPNGQAGGTLNPKEARRAARLLLAEVLTPHMGGSERGTEIRQTLRESAERDNAGWDVFEAKARGIIVGKALDTETAGKAFEALKLLSAHRKHALS